MPYQTQSPCDIVTAFHEKQNTWNDLFQIEITVFPNGKTRTIAKPLRDFAAKQKLEHQQVLQEPNDEPSQEKSNDPSPCVEQNSTNQKLQKMSRELQEEKKLTTALMEQISALEKQKDHDDQALLKKNEALAKRLSVLSEEKRPFQAQLKQKEEIANSAGNETALNYS